jgi:hypothetical protein
MDQVRALLTGRDARFREPLTQREEREYKKVWKRKGKGFTKPIFGSSSERKRKRKKNKWTAERRLKMEARKRYNRMMKAKKNLERKQQAE